MKVKLEMELADVLRISVMLDHHRAEASDQAEGYDKDTPKNRLWSGWGFEASALNEKLLKAVAVSKETK